MIPLRMVTHAHASLLNIATFVTLFAIWYRHTRPLSVSVSNMQTPPPRHKVSPNMCFALWRSRKNHWFDTSGFSFSFSWTSISPDLQPSWDFVSLPSWSGGAVAIISNIDAYKHQRVPFSLGLDYDKPRSLAKHLNLMSWEWGRTEMTHVSIFCPDHLKSLLNNRLCPYMLRFD